MSSGGTSVGDADRNRRRRALVWLGIAWLVLALIGLATVLNNNDDDGQQVAAEETSTTVLEEVVQPTTVDTSDQTVAPETTEATAASDSTSPPAEPPTTEAAPTTTEAPVETTTTEAAASQDSGPNVVAKLDNQNFTLAGTVPSQEHADALIGAANASYAPFVDASGLKVDPAVGNADWLERAPNVIGLLPMITDGSISFGNGEMNLAGRSPNPEYLALFQETVSSLMGIEPASVDVAITDLVAPIFRAEAIGDSITLAGTVASAEIRDILTGAAAGAYGAENVQADIGVDPGVYSSFWMYTMPQVFQLFRGIPEYDFSVIEGITSGTIRKGINFSFDSATLDESALGAVQVAGALLQRDRSLGLLIEGHTDSSGPADYNDLLSLSRAQAVAAVLTDAGIDESRMMAVGKGESEPLESNGTEAGRAANRRVVFTFDIVPQIMGEK